jgi:hypothetical protein
VLNRIYSYHGTPKPPKEVKADVWGAPRGLPEGPPAAPSYFLHYFQSQGLGPTTNECVTTSTVMAMNMIEDRIAASRGGLAVEYGAALRIEDYIRNLDAMGVRGWWYRFSTKSILPGMMTPWGARHALRAHAAQMKKKYGRSYTVRTLPHQTTDELIRALEQEQIVLLHGAWQKRLTDPTDRFLAVLGGMPHTMVLVGYEAAGGFWNILNPAEPWLKDRTGEFTPRLFRMTTEQLVDFWGRKFLFYPPRFSITTLTLE